MRALVSDLLTLSVLESTPSDEHEPITAGPIIQQSIKQGQALSQGKHDFHIEVDDHLAIMGSETELSSVFSNIINNAVRYSHMAGRIHISWNQNPTDEA